ncbi:GntR family transcriptional regulator [Micromonospora sp. KC721]|uniref:GntR family transcriptional regulator n=1 Tax=Micromonospora sp. KC721 TaxID=2530380 RepID=UPI001A9E856F|nr:GntR family transcriptional regulator [Micromonospora sp. KC721]
MDRFWAEAAPAGGPEQRGTAAQPDRTRAAGSHPNRSAGHRRTIAFSRVLAANLGVSRGLITECYAQLQAEGYLVTSPGSATRVAATACPSPDRPVRAADSERIRIDFRPAVPDLSNFPREDWSRAIRRACRQAPTEALGYPDRPSSQPPDIDPSASTA